MPGCRAVVVPLGVRSAQRVRRPVRRVGTCASLFDAMSDSYERVIALTSFGLVASMAAAGVSAGSAPDEERPSWTPCAARARRWRDLAPRLGPRGRPIAIDLSPGMVRRAARRARPPRRAPPGAAARGCPRDRARRMRRWPRGPVRVRHQDPVGRTAGPVPRARSRACSAPGAASPLIEFVAATRRGCCEPCTCGTCVARSRSSGGWSGATRAPTGCSPSTRPDSATAEPWRRTLQEAGLEAGARLAFLRLRHRVPRTPPDARPGVRGRVFERALGGGDRLAGQPSRALPMSWRWRSVSQSVRLMASTLSPALEDDLRSDLLRRVVPDEHEQGAAHRAARCPTAVARRRASPRRSGPR